MNHPFTHHLWHPADDERNAKEGHQLGELDLHRRGLSGRHCDADALAELSRRLDTPVTTASAARAQLCLVESGGAAALRIDLHAAVLVPGDQVVVHVSLRRPAPAYDTEQGVSHKQVAGHNHNA